MFTGSMIFFGLIGFVLLTTKYFLYGMLLIIFAIASYQHRDTGDEERFKATLFFFAFLGGLFVLIEFIAQQLAGA